MDKITNAITKDRVFFSLKENSNYKVMMTYDRSEVIDFQQFKELAKSLGDAPFVTINQRIVKASTIIDISPTDELTETQKAERSESGGNYDNLYIEDDGKLIEFAVFLKREKK